MKKFISDSEFSYINDLLKTSDLKKNLFVFELSSKKIVLISIKKNSKTSDFEKLGAEFFGRINHGKNSEYFLISDSVLGKLEKFFKSFSSWIKKLKSYEFKKYKTKKDKRTILINITGKKINHRHKID